MPKYSSTVTITTDTEEHAATVINERTCFDEDYGFDYSISANPVIAAAPRSIHDLWSEISNHPDFCGGTVFQVSDLESIDVEQADFNPEHVSGRLTEIGWDVIQALASDG